MWKQCARTVELCKSWIGLNPNLSLVNCWFCNENSNIQCKEEELGWICPSCEQYNGFNEDGDYNYPIEGQYELPMEKKVYCRQDSFQAAQSVLCYSCCQNQVLKTGQLASFVPLIESSYDEEVEDYKEYLESVYRLCQPCKDKVMLYLEKQDGDILSKFDDDNLLLKPQGATEGKPSTKFTSKKMTRHTIGMVMIALCLLMSIGNITYCVKINFKSRGIFFNTWLFLMDSQIPLVSDFISLLPGDETMLQVSVYLGAAFCALGLLITEKNCIYVEDALHILIWLLLLISNALTSTSTFATWCIHAVGIKSPVYLILSLSGSVIGLVCLKRSRVPRNIIYKSQLSSGQILLKPQQPVKNTERAPAKKKKLASKELLTESTVSSFLSSSESSTCLFSREQPSSPFGEAHNFFQPIPSPSRSSPALSSASLRLFNSRLQEVPQNNCENVRHNLETFSFGLGKKTGSLSSIWSLPSILSSGAPVSPDSTSPPATAKGHPHSRNILSPSRLSFLSLSSSPVAGKFSSASPTSEDDSGFMPDWNKHCLSENSNDSLSSDNQDHYSSLFSKKVTRQGSNNVSSIPTLHPKHRKEQSSQHDSSCFSDFSSKPTWENIHSLSSGKKVVTEPDSSTPNHPKEKPVQTGPRRSNRIAMRGKIVKPWPLKKSLSVNDMYDQAHSLDNMARRPKGHVENFFDSSYHQSKHSGFHPYKSLNPDLDSERLNAQEFSTRPLNDKTRKRELRNMERIEEFSDDDDPDGQWSRKERKILRGQIANTADTQSQWIWSLYGMIIGISVTVNAFLMWNLWSQRTDNPI